MQSPLRNTESEAAARHPHLASRKNRLANLETKQCMHERLKDRPTARFCTDRRRHGQLIWFKNSLSALIPAHRWESTRPLGLSTAAVACKLQARKGLLRPIL